MTFFVASGAGTVQGLAEAACSDGGIGKSCVNGRGSEVDQQPGRSSDLFQDLCGFVRGAGSDCGGHTRRRQLSCFSLFSFFGVFTVEQITRRGSWL